MRVAERDDESLYLFPPARLQLALPLVLAAVLGLGLVLRPAQTARRTPLAPEFTLPAVARGRGSLALHTLRGHAVLLAYYDVPFLAPRVAAAIRALLPT